MFKNYLHVVLNLYLHSFYKDLYLYIFILQRFIFIYIYFTKIHIYIYSFYKDSYLHIFILYLRHVYIYIYLILQPETISRCCTRSRLILVLSNRPFSHLHLIVDTLISSDVTSDLDCDLSDSDATTVRKAMPSDP